MTHARRAASWSAAPVALLRLDRDGRVLDANATFLAWLGGRGTPATPAAVRGSLLSSLFTVGGRLYWDTHVVPALALAGEVDDVALELRTATGRLPVLLTARRPSPAAASGSGADDGGQQVDVAMFAARRRAEFQQELVRARSAAEHSAARLRWVQQATAALSRVAGTPGVREALLAAVARHPGVADVELRAPDHPPEAPDAGPPPDHPLVVPVEGVHGLHGHLVVHLQDLPGDKPLDQGALRTIAQQGAVALDRARLAEQSVSVAHELQRAMLAVDLPDRPDLEVAAEYRPAVSGLEVGGDWYDVFHLDPTTVAVVVGDVVGHGLASATAMGQLRTATRALARPGLGPGGVLDEVDRFVRGHDIGFGSTLVYAELDTTTATLTYACAGHLPPLRVHRDGTPEYLWDGRSTPLGVPDPLPARPQGTTRLDPGDVVVLFTDGVVERRDRPLQDGLAELAALAVRHARSRQVAERLVDAGASHHDDTCLLTLRWRGPALRR